MEPDVTIPDGIPENWEPWRATAVTERAYGRSYEQIGQLIGRSRQNVALFLASPDALRAMLRIRREAAAVIYGRSLKMATHAMDELDTIIETPELCVDQKLKAIDLVRKIIGDATRADAGTAYRALQLRLKKMRGSRSA
jgi:hypothetical protein